MRRPRIDPLGMHTIPTLRKMAAERGIPLAPDATKLDIIDALRRADPANDPPVIPTPAPIDPPPREGRARKRHRRRWNEHRDELRRERLARARQRSLDEIRSFRHR